MWCVNKPKPPGTRQFLSIDYGIIMNNRTEKNESHTEFVANSPTKRSWQAPEIEEVDLSETQLGSATVSDLSGHS